MASYVSLIVIALAVSLDGCGVGLLYGARKIRIPALSLVIISICSGLVIYGAMKAGNQIADWLDPAVARFIGAFILVAIGCFAVIQFFLHRRRTGEEPVKPTAPASASSRIVRIEIRKIGLVIQIWRSPSIADMDQSGNISPQEASLLGLALSLDALGAGIGAAMVGYPALLTAALIAVVSGLFVAVGLRIGKRAAQLRWMSKLPVLPGILLILIGIVKLL